MINQAAAVEPSAFVELAMIAAEPESEPLTHPLTRNLVVSLCSSALFVTAVALIVIGFDRLSDN